MTDVLQIATSVIGGGFVGSIATHYLTTGPERREIRSKVLARLGDVERTRWAGRTTTRDEFVDALRAFETAALIARLPRDLVRLYKLLAYTARKLSVTGYENGGADEDSDGAIDAEFADLARDTAAEISEAIWAPTRSRIRLRNKVKHLETRALGNEDVQQPLKFNTEHLNYRWHYKTEPNEVLPRPQ